MRFSATAVLATFLIPSLALAQVGLGEDTSTFGRKIHVHATGSPTENGVALTAALTNDIITGRSDPAMEPVLIQLGPGSFEIDTTVMPDHVALRGAGIDATTITDVAVPFSNYLLGSFSTTNWFSHFTVSGSVVDFTIGAVDGAIEIDRIKSESRVGIASQSIVGMAWLR